MHRISKLALILLFALPLAIAGQNYVNNPYTIFGIGDLMNSGFAYNKSLGGSSVALRPHNQVNYLNPASYTAQDTMSVLFHTGFQGRQSVYTTETASDHSLNFNLDYMALGFPITKWCKFSTGLVPFNRVQYNIISQIEDIGNMYYDLKGSGGFNDFYLGASFELTDYISLGMNASYLFGSMHKERIVDYPYAIIASTVIDEKYSASDFHYTLGLQAYPEIVDDNENTHQFIFGASYDIQSNINTKYSSMTMRRFPSQSTSASTDTFNVTTDSLVHLKLPAKIGIGFGYRYNDQLMVTLEYLHQGFSKGIGLPAFTNLTDYSSLRFGTEFTPAPLSARTRAGYLKRVHYRLGAYFTNSYLNLKGTAITDRGLTVGLGLPWRNAQKLYTHTTFNLNYQYGVRGTTDNSLIRDRYQAISIGVTLHDFWFMKPKYD